MTSETLLHVCAGLAAAAVLIFIIGMIYFSADEID